MAAGVSHVRADVWIRMRTAVHRNDSSFVDHLLKNRHESWTLYDLLSVAVNNGEYGARHATCDATNVVTEIFPRRRHRIIVACAFGNPPRSRLRQDVGSSAVGRIHYK